MPDTPDGIAAMRSRIARGQRVPPRPRTATAPPVAPPPVPSPSPPPPAPRPARTSRARAGTTHIAADAPPVNLAIRVRRPLDDALVEVIHALRRRDVRTSKVELIELLLWELAEQPGDIVERLRAFRTAAPRAGHAPLPEAGGGATRR